MSDYKCIGEKIKLRKRRRENTKRPRYGEKGIPRSGPKAAACLLNLIYSNEADMKGIGIPKGNFFFFLLLSLLHLLTYVYIVCATSPPTPLLFSNFVEEKT
jgi:hypothetical protein